MDFKALIHEHSDFLVRLFQQIALTDEQGNGSKNAAVSPISVSITLAMVAAGAKGPTLDQIVSCLRLSDPASLHEFAAQVRSLVLADASPKGGPLLSFVNGIWVEQTLPLKPSFKETVHNKYAAVARSADFLNQAESSRVEINTWVKDETKSIIEEILPAGSVGKDSKLVLANALYFKGAWQKRFNASATAEGDFYLLNGQTVSIPMMTTDKKQEISEYDSFKILRLPYVKGEDGRSFSLYIVLPDERTGLANLEKMVSAEFFEQKLVKRNEVKVGSFKLPRFKVSGGYEMPEVLSKLGLVLPFSNQADFSDMVDSSLGQSLSIDKVYHKAVVEVNEEGTEAAAATAAVIMLRSIPIERDFVADHPFLFVLKEDMTGIVVFIGHFVNPVAT
eukprot:c29439_g1_i1 orf=213-1385(+)